MPHGEAAKTRATWARLTDEMLALGCGRDTTILALGGGVVGDLAGFVAATYMRGVPVVQVPTTLLAMIDAAIGGKTAVDTPAGKNLVGAFIPRPPSSPIRRCWPRCHRASCGPASRGDQARRDRGRRVFHPDRLGDPALLAPGGTATAAMEALITRSIAIKAAVVAEDAREHGRRRSNFGHTIGHAIETASDFGMLHGEAVAIGMAVMPARGVVGRRRLRHHGTGLRGARPGLAPATLPPPGLDGLAPVRHTHSDKKVRAGTVEYALPHAIGEMAGAATGWTVPLPDAFVREALA